MNTNILNLLKQINISKVLGGTSKTLNIIKKSIPVYKEIRPYVRKEKTFFKKDETESSNWADSYLRKWLNEDFYETTFSEAEKKYILNCRYKKISMTNRNKNKLLTIIYCSP